MYEQEFKASKASIAYDFEQFARDSKAVEVDGVVEWLINPIEDVPNNLDPSKPKKVSVGIPVLVDRFVKLRTSLKGPIHP